jgi:hypothetical protein
MTGELVDIWHRLNNDEQTVLLEVARGLDVGRAFYGGLDLENDTRDFRAETMEEVRDALVYVGAELSRLRKARAK